MQWQTISKLASAAALTLATMAAPGRLPAQSSGNAVLKAADVQTLFPASVYYCGHTATAQMRNSGGVKFSDGHYVLAALVDTSGYSTGIAAKYQGYFITEVPLHIGGQSLPAGIYGIGFIAGDQFAVTDVGAHDVFTVSSSRDGEMKRPMPLQVQADPGGGFRLYAGRSYVSFSR